MTNHECAKTLRRGLNKYLENSMYVPGFADALRHAISELERGPVNNGQMAAGAGTDQSWIMDRFMRIK